MPPAVAPAAQVRTARAAVTRQPGWHFSNSQIVQGRFYDHFTGELHPRRAQVNLLDRRLVKAAQTAMKIAAGAAKEKTSNRGQHRVPEVFVQEGHCAWFDAAFETITHHQIVSGAKLCQKGPQV